MTAKRMRRRNLKYAVIFLLLPFLAYTILMIVPLLTSLVQSLYSYDGSRNVVFSGLENYRELLTDPSWSASFWNAMWHSVEFFLINMFIQNPIALFLATLLASRTKFNQVYRTILYLPCMLSIVMVAFVWQMMLNPTWGIVRDAMELVGMGEHFAPWLGQKSSALITLALISAWQNIGTPVLLYYSSLISIPSDLIDASHVDGCTGFQTFLRVKLPMVMPMVATVSLMTYIFNFNAFDLIYAVKGPMAGPDFSTDTMMSLFFRTFYGHQLQQPDPYMGATIACVILMLMLIGVLIYLFASNRANNKIS